MKFLLRVGVPLIVLIVLLVPGAVGRLAEPHLVGVTDQLGDELAAYATETGSELQRGWFSSHWRGAYEVHDAALAESFLMLAALPLSTAAPMIEASATLHHGPVPMTAPRRGGLLPAAGALSVTLDVISGGQRARLPLSVVGRVSLGGVTAIVHLDGVANRAFDSVSVLTFAGGTIRLRGNRALDHFAGRAELGAVSVRSTLSTESGLEIERITVRADTGNSDTRTLGRLSLELGESALAGQICDGLRADLAFDADRQSLRAWLESLGALPDDPDAASAAVLAGLVDLAAGGADVRMNDIYVGTQFGAASGRVSASLPAGDNDPLNMLRRASGAAYLQIPVALAGALAGLTPDAGKQLRTALAAGIIRKVGDDYVSDIVYDSGELEVNGFPVPLPL